MFGNWMEDFSKINIWQNKNNKEELYEIIRAIITRL